MKIAHVVCVFPPYKSGIGNVAYHFSEIMKDDYEITVFTPDYKKQQYLDFKGFKVCRLKPFLKFGNGALLLQLIFKLKKFDIVHLHYPFFGTAEMIWLMKIFKFKFKLIIHYHMDTNNLSFFANILSIPSRLIQKSLFKKSDAIVCASVDYIENSSIKNIYFKNREKFYEIPFGVDTEKFKFKKNINNDDKTILFVGGLDRAHYFKGINILFEAISKLKIKNYRLKVVGDGELKGEYINKSKQLGLNNKVEFLGRISDIDLSKEYQKADLFVLPSINNHEAFGLVLLEAMACGVPVIASSLPGVRSVFKDEEQGLLVEPNNKNDLTKKIETILLNDSLREEMSRNSLKLINEKYSWKKVGEKLSKLYNNLVI
ncbi:glycosyltransferase family 4 protein [Candidatus Parcubacteria bacterium]|nr:glycosyltransferase family 4 protein [Candidatus Parcubacteria bacterium]